MTQQEKIDALLELINDPATKYLSVVETELVFVIRIADQERACVSAERVARMWEIHGGSPAEGCHPEWKIPNWKQGDNEGVVKHFRALKQLLEP